MMSLWPSAESITIEWGGLSFQSIHEQGESPQWGLEDTDWWDGGTTDPDTYTAPRGVWVGEAHEAARTVSWAGLLETCSREDLLAEMQALQSAHGSTVQVWESGTGRKAVCRRGSVKVTPISDRHATYSVMVVLDDPLVSSVDEIAVGGSVTNTGTAHSRPVVKVTAPGVAPTVTIGGWSVKAPRALVGSEVFTVDCRTGTLYLGNAAVFPVLTTFPAIAPGTSVTVSTSAGSGTVDGVSAWL